MKLCIEINEQGRVNVLLDEEPLGLLHRVAMHTGTDGLPSVTIFLPKIPTGSPPELLSTLLAHKDRLRELLAPMRPWVEIVDSDTIPSMPAIQEG